MSIYSLLFKSCVNSIAITFSPEAWLSNLFEYLIEMKDVLPTSRKISTFTKEDSKELYKRFFT